MSANYWEQIPALTPLQFYKPYQPAYEEKLKTIQAQTAYWQEGARQVNSVLDKANQLSLITENKDRAQKFEQEADNKIVDLTKNSLAVNGIASQALNVYAPLFNDSNIRGEDNLLKNNTSVLATNEAEKTKDGGKNYNPALDTKVNAQIALMRQYGKKDAWKINQPVEYQPYYDTAKEDNEIMKNVVGDITIREQLIPMEVIGPDGKRMIDPKGGVYTAESKNADIDYMRLYQQAQAKRSDKYRAQKKLESDADFATSLLVMTPEELGKKYADKAFTSFETNKRYTELEIEQNKMRMTNLEKDSDKTALEGIIAKDKAYLERLTADYNKNLGFANEISTVKDKIFKLNDITALQRVNSLANMIDDQYDITQFAVNNSYQNNSIKYKSAPANFLESQKSYLSILEKQAEAEAKAAKEAKKAAADGKGNDEYSTLKSDGYNTDGTLKPNALEFNQSAAMNVQTESGVAPSGSTRTLLEDAVYNEKRKTIKTIEKYKKEVEGVVTSGLFSDNKGIVSKLISGGVGAEEMEDKDIDVLADKLASINYLTDMKKFGKSQSAEALKEYYKKNLSPISLIKAFNAKINEIVQPDEEGNLDEGLTSVLVQGLTKDQKKDFSFATSSASSAYQQNTLLNLEISSRVIRDTDPAFYKYLESKKLIKDGRLVADVVNEELKNFYKGSTLENVYKGDYVGMGLNINKLRNQIEGKEITKYNEKRLNVVNALKKEYFDVYSKDVENVNRASYTLETRNDNNGKGTADDINKLDNVPMQSMVSDIISEIGKVLYKDENGKLKPASEATYGIFHDFTKAHPGKNPITELGVIVKRNIGSLNSPLKSFSILQDIIDTDGTDDRGNKNNSNAKELTVTLNFNQLLEKSNTLRDDLDAKGFLDVDDKGKYSFKPEFKNIFATDGLQFKVNEEQAKKIGLNDEFFQKRSDASAASRQTKKGGGLKFTLYDNDGVGSRFRIKNTATLDDPQFALIDLDNGLDKLNALRGPDDEKITPESIMQGLMSDYRSIGTQLSSKTIGDNMRHRTINLWYKLIDYKVKQ